VGHVVPGRRGGDRAARAAGAALTWLAEVGRKLGGDPQVLRRGPLAGGYSAGAERVDLLVDGREVPVVVKPADPAEVAALRAVAVVEGARVPRLLAADPVVLSWVDGEPGSFPAEAWRTLARVHRHWFRRRPRGIPVLDAALWAGLCDWTLRALDGARTRTGDGGYEWAAEQVRAWAHDDRIRAALAVLPRTLCHGDPHRGNVLGGTLIDWGNAKIAPAGLDVAVVQGQSPCDPAPYRAEFPELPGPLAAVEREWAWAHVHVQYLGFTADHLGVERVAEMVEQAAEALARLEPALRALATAR
jgi:hypothetical protein